MGKCVSKHKKREVIHCEVANDQKRPAVFNWSCAKNLKKPSTCSPSVQNPPNMVNIQISSTRLPRISREILTPGGTFFAMPTSRVRVSTVSNATLPGSFLSSSRSSRSIQQQKYAMCRPVLTVDEERAVMTSWNQVKYDMEKTGVVMFLSMFQDNPEMQLLFSTFSNLPPDSVANTAVFKRHALNFFLHVEKIIARAYDHEFVENKLHELGDMHKQRGLTRKKMFLLVPYFVKAIKPAFHDNWTELLNTSWTKFIRLLNHVMSERLRP